MAESEEVVRILKTSNLYEILCVEKTCDNNDLKRSYRKIATKVHPDRCKDPGATEAFQKVSHAYQILSDEGKRRNYDQFGDERGQTQPTFQHHQGQYGSTRFYTTGDDIDAEELFRMFFGNNFGPNVHFTFGGSPFDDDIFGNARYRRATRRQPPQSTNEKFKQLFFMLLPILVLLVLSQLTNFLFSSKRPDGLKIELQKNIIFPVDDEKLVEDDFNFVMKSKKYGKQFSVPKQWKNEMLRHYKAAEFYSAIPKYADEIYKQKLTQKCEIEKRKGGSRPSCVELKKLS